MPRALAVIAIARGILRRSATVLALAACAVDPPAAPLLPIATITIDGAPVDGVLLIGSALTLRATVRAANDVELNLASVAWRSSDANLATVSTAGVVQGERPGEITVSASASGLTAERALSVRIGVPLPPDGQPLTSTLLSGAVRITVNAGAIAPPARLNLRADPAPPPHARLIDGTAIELGPPGLGFAAPVVLALRIPSSVASADRPFTRLARLVNGAWVDVAGSDVGTLPGFVMGTLSATGRYALFRRAAPASLRVLAGDAQLGLPGIAVAIAPAVVVRDAAGASLPGIWIRFAPSLGGGAIVGVDSAISNAAGEATLPGAWRLGADTGSNALLARVIAVPTITATFTAVAERVTLIITRQLADAVSGRVALTQPRLEFRTASGTLLPVSDGVRAQLVSGTGTLLGTLEVQAVGGVATFTDLRIDGSGAHRLRFTSGGLQVTGAEVVVTQSLASLVVVTQPGGAVRDKKFTAQPVVRLLDDAGLPFLSARTVTVSIASGAGDLRGDATRTSVAGIATFSDLRIDDATGLHTLRFATTSPVHSVISLPFNVLSR